MPQMRLQYWQKLNLTSKMMRNSYEMSPVSSMMVSARIGPTPLIVVSILKRGVEHDGRLGGGFERIDLGLERVVDPQRRGDRQL